MEQSQKILIFVLIVFITFQAKISLAQNKSTTTNNIQPKYISLTFDDGPNGTTTEEILSILKKENVTATFFMIGENVEKYPSVAKDVALSGQEIGNHSYSHSKKMTSMSTSTLMTDITEAENIIASTTGVFPSIFRPPYGSLSTQMENQILKSGYKIAGWTLGPDDWNYSQFPPSKIVSYVLTRIKPGDIILLHDGRDLRYWYPSDNTVKALPELIEKLKVEGYTFVPPEQLLTSKRISISKNFLTYKNSSAH